MNSFCVQDKHRDRENLEKAMRSYSDLKVREGQIREPVIRQSIAKTVAIHILCRKEHS